MNHLKSVSDKFGPQVTIAVGQENYQHFGICCKILIGLRVSWVHEGTA